MLSKWMAHAEAGVGTFATLLGEALRFMKDVRIVPVDEYALHVNRPPSQAAGVCRLSRARVTRTALAP